MLPVKEDIIILCKQYLLGYHRWEHPNRHLLEVVPPPGHNRKRVLDYTAFIQRYRREPRDRTAYRQALKIFMNSLPTKGALGIR